MDTIPANYPSNRNLVGKAVLGALADSADVKLALKMINASDDQSCQNAMMVAACGPAGSKKSLPKTRPAALA